MDEQPEAPQSRDPGEVGLEAWTLFPLTHVPYRLLLLAKMLERQTVAQLRETTDLSLAEWRVLAHLGVMGEKTASALSMVAFADRAEVSRALAGLERRGLVGRRPNPRNRKSPLLFLTDKGGDLQRRVQQQRVVFFAEVTADLCSEELALMDKWLLKMALRVNRAGPQSR
ncbi:MAG TPA: MarR family transcriptional regulator [Sphingomonadaceae bacterium]